MEKTKLESNDMTNPNIKTEKANCGIVMPISAHDGCPAEHWAEVKNILTEAIASIETPEFSIKLVSDADDIGIIQKRIIQNIYTSDIIVCDVSGKNPNVMFELGMRLAFDKPVVLVKDDKTDYSFDTSIIEHITYPRDLRFTHIVDFKNKLAVKIIGTYNKAISEPDQSPFLKNFGRFTVANLDETTVSSDRLLLDLVEEVRSDVRRLESRISASYFSMHRNYTKDSRLSDFCRLAGPLISKYMDREKISDLRELIDNKTFYREMEEDLDAHKHFPSRSEFEETLKTILLRYQHDLE